MKKLIPFIILSLLMVSCFEDNPDISSSPHITSFGFGYHKDVPGLESCKFTVDSIALEIYNKDSLSHTSNLTKLRPYLTFTGSPHMIWVNGKEWNKKDSIDFTNEVKMEVESENKKNKATYTIRVNKHQVNPNEIHWKQYPSLVLPENQVSSAAIAYQNNYYLFVTLESGLHQVYTSLNLEDWTLVAEQNEAIAVRSIQTGLHGIYGVSQDGHSFWQYQIENKKWERICSYSSGQLLEVVGNFGELLLVSYKDNANQIQLLRYNAETHQLLPHTTAEPLPNTFAEEGSSKVRIDNALHCLGGSRNGQVLTNLIASENGIYWTDLFHQPTEFAYPARTQATASLYEDIILLFGGTNQAGEILSDIYFSENFGYSWSPATNDMKLPEDYQAKSGMSSICKDKYIYLVGGQTAVPQASIEIWRGQLRKTDFVIQ